MTLRNSEILDCKECGGKPCICSDNIVGDGGELWAAHCMNCDNTIGKRGVYDPCAKSKLSAIILWNKLNRKD